MNYQDHVTKLLHLRPLKSKRAAEVAIELLKIFLEFGFLFILQLKRVHRACYRRISDDVTRMQSHSR